MNQDEPKKKKHHEFSIRIPNELYSKLDYIKKRSFLSKQQIMLICSKDNMEIWFKKLMEEEIQVRIKNPKVIPENKMFVPDFFQSSTIMKGKYPDHSS